MLRVLTAVLYCIVKRGATWARNGRWILPENARLPRNIQGSFTCRKSTTWDKRLYFPSEGRRAEDFFALKNPTAWAGFEPANLGTKGQHATSRPPKPLNSRILSVFLNVCELCFTAHVDYRHVDVCHYQPLFVSTKLEFTAVFRTRPLCLIDNVNCVS